MATQPDSQDAERPVPALEISSQHRLVRATGAAQRWGRRAPWIAAPVLVLLVGGVLAGLVLARGTGPGSARPSALSVVARTALQARVHDRAGRQDSAAGVARAARTAAARAAAARTAGPHSRAARGARVAHVSAHTAGARVAASPHVLSETELVSLASGSTRYRPAPSLARVYRAAAARYRIPWRLLAAVEYASGGHGHASAGAAADAERLLARQVRTSGAIALQEHVLAQVAGQAAGPSPALLHVASSLAAAGARRSPGAAAAAVLRGTATSPQAVLTLAQATDTSLTAAASPRAKIAAMLDEAHLLNGLPYIWGGGHTNPAWVVGAGYDCSGFVSAVLHAGGYLNSPDTTQTLPGSAGILNGPGKYVTIYDRTIATLRVRVKKLETRTVRRVVAPNTFGVHVTRGRRSRGANAIAITVPRWVGAWKTVRVTRLVPSEDTTNNDEHVIIDIDGQWWESGGSTADGGGAMVHRILDPNPAYLKSFNRVLHPQGL